MGQITRQLAKSLIAPSENKRKIFIVEGDTDDIIFAITEADKESAKFVTRLAPILRGTTQLQTCKNVFDFVHQQIRYVIDGDKEQIIKSPSQTINTGFADCKSMSVLIGALLKNLGIGFKYRFTTYTPSRAKDKLVSHVYVVTLSNIIIDPVWGIFNSEKRYLYKKDIMPEVSYIAGIGRFNSSMRNQQTNRSAPKAVSSGVKDKSTSVFRTHQQQATHDREQAAIQDRLRKEREAKAKRTVFDDFGDTVREGGKQLIRVKNDAAKGIEKWADRAGADLKKAAEDTKNFALRNNPVTALLRGSAEMLTRLNVFSMATLLNYGYMTDAELAKRRINSDQARRLRNEKDKVVKYWIDIARGTDSEFRAMVSFGNSKKAFLTGTESEAQIGEIFAGTAVGTAIAAAAPFIAIVGGLGSIAGIAVGLVNDADTKKKDDEERKRIVEQDRRDREKIDREDKLRITQEARQRTIDNRRPIMENNKIPFGFYEFPEKITDNNFNLYIAKVQKEKSDLAAAKKKAADEQKAAAELAARNKPRPTPVSEEGDDDENEDADNEGEDEDNEDTDTNTDTEID